VQTDRLAREIWLGAEAGVGGFRRLRLDGTDVETPDLDVGTSPYAGIELKFRPSLEF
jgi:hypothetical protein